MLIVCDASSLITLATCQALPLLQVLFDEVVIAKAVYEEITVTDKPYAKEIQSFFCDKVLDDPSDADAISNSNAISHSNLDVLDRGEKMSLLLYQQHHADFLLIDEKLGRKIALSEGARIIGSLGVLVLAKKSNLIDGVRPYAELIVNSNIFISKKLINDTLISLTEEPIP